MWQTRSLVVILLGLSGVLGCSEVPSNDDTKAAMVPESTETFARAAVEVGTIDLAHMVEVEASVERMNRNEQTRLWQSLRELHDVIHPSEIGVSFEEEGRSEEHTSELQSRLHLVCRLLLEKK